MDALGIPPPLAGLDRPIQAPASLPARTNIPLLWDIFAGILLGYASRCMFGGYVPGDMVLVGLDGPLLRWITLGSVIAALVLREGRLADGVELPAARQLVAALISRSVAAGLILVCVCLITRGPGDMTRAAVISWCTVYLLYVCISRILMRAHLRRSASYDLSREAVAVIGAPDVAGRLAHSLARNAAVVQVDDDIDDPDNGAPAVETVIELLGLVRSGEVDTVVVSLDPHENVGAQSRVRRSKFLPDHDSFVSPIATPMAPHRTLPSPGRAPILVSADRPLTQWDLLAKAALDKVGASLLLLATAPLIIVIALSIVLDSPGPLIFRQRRNGWGGQLFTIYKFRTMRHESSVTTARQTERNDPRRTRVGAFLRRTSLDELPQLWNVLRGEMSLVGPRPHADVLHEGERFGCTVVAEYARRHRMRPGLTGWAQIHGARGAVSSQEALRRRIAYDLYYIDNWSMALDLLILARTPWILLTGENAY